MRVIIRAASRAIRWSWQCRTVAAGFTTVIRGRHILAGRRDINDLPCLRNIPVRILIVVRPAACERAGQVVLTAIRGERADNEIVVTACWGDHCVWPRA